MGVKFDEGMCATDFQIRCFKKLTKWQYQLKQPPSTQNEDIDSKFHCFLIGNWYFGEANDFGHKQDETRQNFVQTKS